MSSAVSPIRLYYYPGNANFAPHVVLRELGLPFELELIDRSVGAHKLPAYLALNPEGLIPVLIDGDLVLHETAAILLHLADRVPGAGLAPALGTAERAEFYKWLIWLTNTVQAKIPYYLYPDRMVAGSDADAAALVKAAAKAELDRMLALIDAQLGKHEGGYLLASGYSVADPFLFIMCRWTRSFPTGAARSYPHITRFLETMRARPAVAATIEAEQLAEPLY